jgi:hypothetical protein
MKMRNPIVGEYYRHKNSPDYCWAKVLNVLEAKQYPNDKNYKVAECEWVTSKSNDFGLIKHFKVSDLIKN